jgi:hypothetical protein
MAKFLSNFKKSTKVFIFTLVWWTTSIMIFGDFSNQSRWLLLLFSIISMGLLINFRWRANKDRNFFGPNIWYLFLSGVFLSIFGLNPFMVSVREPIVSFTIDTSFSIIGWWINIIGFVSGASIYRELKREELSKEFDGDFEAYRRDVKINKITGNWWD